MKISWSAAMKSSGLAVGGSVVFPVELLRGSDIVSIDLLAAAVRAEATPQLCTAEGEVKTAVTYRCARCLVEFPDRLETRFREEFSRLPPTPEQEQAEVVHCPGDEIVMDPYVEQAVVLALPAQPLCKADCLGLCPVCGADLNMQTCGCDAQEVDPRLEALSLMYGKLTEQ
ncbi:MAG: YceD family protein [Bacilli bacterium]